MAEGSQAASKSARLGSASIIHLFRLQPQAEFKPIVNKIYILGNIIRNSEEDIQYRKQNSYKRMAFGMIGSFGFKSA